MKILTQADIFKIMAEDYQKQLKDAINEIEIFTPDGKKILISPELKVRHGSSGLLYTIDSVGAVDVTLRTPEGKMINIEHDEFEKEYNLD